jgi:hypothetical protein
MGEDQALSDSQQQLVSWLSSHVQIHRSREGAPSWSYSCVEELVLSLGYWGIPAALPSHHRRGPERACYANAAAYGSAHHLVYVEGYALTRFGLVCEHAWCVDEYAQVHDPTWQDSDGTAYLGVPFAASYLDRFDRRFLSARPLLDFHLDDYRILRNGLPREAVTPIRQPNAASGSPTSS